MKKQFFNADSIETSAIFSGLSSKVLTEKPEVRPEETTINIYKHIDDGNKRLEQARIEAAKISDATQTLVNGPVTMATESETVSLDDLPAIVRQAAEASLLKRAKKNPGSSTAKK